MAGFCHGPVAILRLAVFSSLPFVLILLWCRPEVARLSIASLSPSDVNIKHDVQSGALDEHPVKTLAKKAALDFQEMFAKQSDSFEKAEAEYLRRYKRSPPLGFAKWYEYATAKNSLIIDDFDGIDRAIQPFLQRSGAEMAELVSRINETEASSFSCNIEDGRLQVNCGILGNEFWALFEDARILTNLPSMEFMLNGLDEPRVLLKQQPSDTHSRRFHRHEDIEAEPIVWERPSRKMAWDFLVLDRCRDRGVTHSDIHSPASTTDSVNTLGIPFMHNRTNALDVCLHPEYEHLHGLWESPESLQVTGHPLLMLSPAVLSTMSDIPFPSPADTQGLYSNFTSELVDYSTLTPGLYWAGSSTGGHQTIREGGFVPLHRQRFVALANNIDQVSFDYLQRQDNHKWEVRRRDGVNDSSYHVHFTGIAQCDEAACRHQEEYFTIHPHDSEDEGTKHTLVFDVDGNGHSARYYRLLMSSSLPLKQTVFRQWHDDRLQPWLHFVPISLEMKELPEVVRYLVEEEEGRVLAKNLALEGREWALKVLRREDQVIYLYRLLLELARVQDPNRQPMFQ